MIHKRDEFQKYLELYKEIEHKGDIIFPGTLLQRAAQKWPNRTALLCEDKKITYTSLYEKANRFTNTLLKIGITPTDRILLIWQNSIEFYIAYYGIWQTGAIVAPINTLLHESEIGSIIEDAKPKALVVSEMLAPKIEKQTNHLTTFFEKEINLNDPITQEMPTPNIPKKSASEVAVILYTSGTTGRPKGVMLSGKNIMINLIQGASRLNIVPEDRVYGALPFFHAFSQNCCIWGPLFFGCSVIVVPKIERRALLKGLQLKPTFFLGVPAFYGLLALMKNAPVNGIKHFVSGADVLSNKIRSYFELLYGRKICNGYGLTETSPFISVNFDDVTTVSGNVGQPFPALEISIKDESGNPLPEGKIGVLWVKGDNVMIGYYNEPEATDAVLKNGWFNTGDLAYIDKRKNIILTGRVKDIIIHKGINIYPPEIENILVSDENVSHAAVVGKKLETEEIPIAFVTGPDIEKISEQVLKNLCVQSLAPYKVPRRIIVMKKLPMTATGKINKRELPIDDVKL